MSPHIYDEAEDLNSNYMSEDTPLIYIGDKSTFPSSCSTLVPGRPPRMKGVRFDTDIDILELDCGRRVVVKIVAAWAVLLASYSGKDHIEVMTTQARAALDPITISVQWNESIKDLIHRTQAQLTDYMSSLEKPESSGDEASSSGSEPEYEQIFAVALTRDTNEVSQKARDGSALMLQCHTSESKIRVGLGLNASPADRAFSSHVCSQWEHIVRALCSPEGMERSLMDLKAITTQDLERVWSWNVEVPLGSNRGCIHDRFMDRASRQPEAPAVNAHDGDWTYRELDERSTRLAHSLIRQGLQPNEIVVVYMEKSKWVPVAQLAIMKAGCASTVLDASLPLERQKVISNLVQARCILTSPTYRQAAGELNADHAPVLVDSDSSQKWPVAQTHLLPAVSILQRCYVVFTSGSTGTPKGVVITHQNYVSAVLTQQKALGFREFDRVFDFTSYAFDVAWCNLIHTMTIGGCLCIPSDEERKGDIAAALHKYQPNYVALTPSIAWFSASDLPASVRTFHLGGEPLNAALVKQLSARATVVHAYGPAECSTVSTAFTTDPSSETDPPIGRGLGCCTWIAKLDGSDLAPVGDVGELWVDGPIVGQGYLGDPEKTAASFVEDPSWLLRGCPPLLHQKGHAGRRGRLYRTGDLVRYRSDGNLEFVGRKDSQVKIRGQRVELGEIEHHLARALTKEAKAANVQIIAEVIKPKNSSVTTLVSFVFLGVASKVSPADAKEILAQAVDGLQDRLAKLVPPYMIPSAFLTVAKVPMTPTGKVDRRGLRESGPDMYWRELESQETLGVNQEVASETEKTIRQVWSKVLNLPLDKIGLDTNFTRLGGDSISAMQVVSRCRQENISLSVSTILKLQTISSLAQASKPVAQNAKTAVAVQEDDGKAWPLSPIQQMFFDDNPEGANHYSLSYITKLTRRTTHDELNAALVAVTTRHAMLRARFRKSVAAQGSTWEQYTAPPDPSSFGFTQHSFVAGPKMQLIVDQRQASLDLVKGPVFAVDVFSAPGEDDTLLMSAHHVVMDLVSWRVIWHDLSRFLSGLSSLPPVELSFTQWCQLQREEGHTLEPAHVLPFEVNSPNYDYWGVQPGHLFSRDSTWHTSIIDEQATSLLLGASNDCLGTEILDILLGTLVYSFAQTFPDRAPAAVFVETHGREAIADMNHLDLSETVGWFTSIFPVQLGGGPASSVLDMIKFAKDTRRRVPGKGRPYFACRYHSSAGLEVFQAHKHPELIFNYRGLFQQLEDAGSMFKLEDREERQWTIPAEGPDYRPPSLVDMNLVIEEGRLHVATRSHKLMRNHEAVIKWLDLYAKTLQSVSHELATSRDRHYTLMDFPLLQISYSGLETLMTKQLASQGIQHADVKDIYPCTPMQEGILLSAITGTASYQSACIWSAQPSKYSEPVSLTRLAEAWEIVSSMHPACSTIFLTHPDTGRYVQVVLKKGNKALLCDSAQSETAVEHLEKMQTVEAHPSQPQCFFTICSSANGEVACRIDMTHALMDALSLPVLARDLEEAYSGQAMSLRTPFRDVVEYLERRSAPERLSYWTTYLSGVQGCELPGDMVSSSSTSKATPDSTQYGWVRLPPASTASISRICRQMDMTRSAFLQIAWSLVLSRLTGTRDVCFGYISSGRDAAVDGIEDVVGPLINMLIARVDLEKPLRNLAASVNKFNIEHLDNQHVSLAEIQHQLSVKKLFNTTVTVGEARRATESTSGSMRLVETMEQDPHEYDLVLAATLDKDDTHIGLHYRRAFASPANANVFRHTLLDAIEYLGSVVDNGVADDDGALYDAYFHHSVGMHEPQAVEQWKAQFLDLDAGCSFPSLPYSSDKVQINETASHSLQDVLWRQDCRVTTQVLASWALLQASYGGSTDVLIGWRGQRDAMPRPMRAKMDLNQTLWQFLESVQSTVDIIDALPELGIDRIRRLSGDTALACDFHTVWNVREATDSVLESNVIAESYPHRALSFSFVANESAAEISAVFDSHVISHEQVTRMLCQLETVLRQVCLPQSSSSVLAQIHTVSDNDMASISSWNNNVPDAVHTRVHDIFAKTVQAMPDALAISSWDGELTYRQLDQLSTRLAHRLTRLGVGPDVVVPMYFEKSMWEPVSVLAVMKAGGAGVAIDSVQPIGRAQSIVNQVNANVVLVSMAMLERAVQLHGPALFVVNQASIHALPDPQGGLFLPQEVQPSHLVYVCFTSGSTGQPKGAMITHTNFASAIEYQQTAMGFRPGRRVFDFANYAFDVAWSNVLHTLTSGSCLCIPSEHQRSNDLAGAIRDSKATFLDITPSMLRHLDPTEFPDLETVMLGGEPFTEADMAEWFTHKEMINTYGPAECSVRATITTVIRGIGIGYGMNTWIVTVDGSDRLTPMGAIGELWLEGPLVGRGYLGNEAKTASAFVTRPKWGRPDEQARFYRTGDLVRYEATGNLICVGRKDNQIKIRGQRTELGEIEHNIQTALLAVDFEPQIVADVFKPQGSDSVILVAFLKCGDKAEVQHKLAGLDERLADMIPEYMIPTVYIGLDAFPVTSNGKTDRKALRLKYADMSLEQLVSNDVCRGSDHRAPSSSPEKLMRDLWAAILKLDPNSISADASFFRIGGDSLGAMRLVSAAREKGVVFSVADVFQKPQLSLLASIIEIPEKSQNPASSNVEPFSLIADKMSLEEAKVQTARLCGVEPSDIEDVFPCTSLQEGLLAETVRRPGDNILTETKTLRNGVNTDRLLKAWAQVVQTHPILRTRIVNLPDQGLVQVIIRHERCDLQGRTSDISDQEFGLGSPLVHCTISPTTFTWRIHHALYDGWSRQLIMTALGMSYSNLDINHPTPFQNFVKHVEEYDKAQAEDFWKAQFRDLDAQNFPPLPSKTYEPRCDSVLERDLSNLNWDGDFTAATKIRLAWAIVLSAATNSGDVSFGTTVSGRQAPVPGVENVSGPTFATVPLRIILDPKKTVKDLLQQVQLQAAEMVPFEQIGLQQIQRMSEDCNLGCQFQSHMVIQPADQESEGDVLFDSSANVEVGGGDVHTFEAYAISIGLEFLLRSDGVTLHASYDSTVVNPSWFARISERFEGILRQLCSPEVQGKPLMSINISSKTDLKQIWSWNKSPLETCHRVIHDIFAEVADKQPEAAAICAWDGDFTYRQLDVLSTRLAHELIRAGVARGSRAIVPLLFEKSKWTSVSQFGVMKAGGTSVILDSTLPIERLRTVFGIAKPEFVLVSKDQEGRARELAPAAAQIIVIDDFHMSSISHPTESHLPVVDPDTWAYVVFTSGSTGTPKGAIISHSNFTSALHYGLDALGFGLETRSYDLASYAFDVSWVNLLYTLCGGGCLCIPTEHEIRNDPTKPVDRMQINTAQLTPTVAKLFRGSGLKTINFGGENLPRDEIDYWKDKAKIMHSYGPSECTPCAVSHLLDPARDRVIIGKGLGTRTWVVEPDLGTSLMAIGDIGELWLEGPLVGQGYLNEKEKTDAAFIQNPEWLLRGAPGFSGRQGTLYRTGDLVRYQEDGNLEFIGRKDAQVKIRGQRVELEEVEHYVLAAIGAVAAQVVVDIAKPADSDDRVLIAFIKLADQQAMAVDTVEDKARAHELAASAKDYLQARIPAYMIPNAYLIVHDIPKTPSGKVERGRLRKIASALPRSDLFQTSRKQRRAPRTPGEMKLHAIVSRALNIDVEAFGMDDNFIQLGGDSISAMRLAAMASVEGLTFTVANVLTKKRLVDLVDLQGADQTTSNGHLPFSLLPTLDLDTFLNQRGIPQGKSGQEKLIDILPATHLQAEYLRDNLCTPRRSWFYSWIEFSDIENEELLIRSCEQVFAQCDIYRTTFFLSDGRFYQAIFDSWTPNVEIIHDPESADVGFQKIIAREATMPVILEAPLAYFTLVRGPSGDARLVFSMSHAVYDAISLYETLKVLANNYNGQVQPSQDWAHYMRHIESHKAKSYDYWRQALEGSKMTTLPLSTLEDGLPTVLAQEIPMPDVPVGITRASQFTLACAASLGQAAGQSDVVLGRVVSGRVGVDATLQNSVGPCLNRVPVRVYMSVQQSRADRLAAVQKQYAESLAHETVGLSDIVHNCTDWPKDVDRFGCLVQYQNVSENPELDIPGAVGGLRSREVFDVPLAADVLEFFAIPVDDGARLRVRVIVGRGYGAAVAKELLREVIRLLSESFEGLRQ